MKMQPAIRLATLLASSLGLLCTQAWCQSSLLGFSPPHGSAMSGLSAGLPAAPAPAPVSSPAGICTSDDYLEENDDCNQAVALGNGTYPDLFVSMTDWDYYLVSVPPGSSLSVSVSHIAAEGDIDVFLYPGDSCASFADGNVRCAGALDCGFSSSNLETVSYTNTSAECETLILKLNLWVFSPSDCNEYTMIITGAGGFSIGTSYCAQNVNSTGGAASILALGNAFAVNDQLSLVASGMPANQVGYFLVAMEDGLLNLPGLNLSDGFLCLGDGIGRYSGQGGNPGGLLDSGEAGSFCLADLDTTMIPLSSGSSYAVVAGTSSYFTAWFRDPSGAIGNNFTDAVRVDWQ